MTIAPQGTAGRVPGLPATTAAPAPVMSLVGGSTMSFSPPSGSTSLAVGMVTTSTGALGVVPAGSAGTSSINSALLGSGIVGGIVGGASLPAGSTEIRMVGGNDGYGSFTLPSTSIAPASSFLPPLTTTGGAAAAPATTGGGAIAPVVGTIPTVAPTTTAAATGVQSLTTLAPGGQASDAALVQATLDVLRRSPSGAQVVDRLLAANARINVISDEEFRAMGEQDAHAFYDPKSDTMYLRRSELADEKNRSFAAVALAHEGTHLLDDLGGVGDPLIQEISAKVTAAGGLNTPAGIEARDQGLFELMLLKETRAFTFAGAVARDLGVRVGDNDPTSTAIAGGNDQQTYAAVWERLLRSSYNDQHRTAAVRFG